MVSFLKRLIGNLSQDEAERRANEVRRWAESLPGVTLIASASPRSVVRIAGVVEGLRVRPRAGVPAIEAVVTDGSGVSCTAIWLGRRSLPGLTLGRRLIMEGRVGEAAGQLQMMNPSFEFESSGF